MYLQFVSIMIQSHKISFAKDNWGFDSQYYHNKDKTQLRIKSNLWVYISA